MIANCVKAMRLSLILAILHCVLLVGCNSQSRSRSKVSCLLPEIEGKWSWQQEGPGGPWGGYFILEKKGSSYVGTLDDTSEGTYGDKVLDITVSNEHIKFTRYGRFCTQNFEGDLMEENGRFKIINGQWTDTRWGKDPKPLSFSAEKTE